MQKTVKVLESRLNLQLKDKSLYSNCKHIRIDIEKEIIGFFVDRSRKESILPIKAIEKIYFMKAQKYVNWNNYHKIIDSNQAIVELSKIHRKYLQEQLEDIKKHLDELNKIDEKEKKVKQENEKSESKETFLKHIVVSMDYHDYNVVAIDTELMKQFGKEFYFGYKNIEDSDIKVEYELYDFDEIEGKEAIERISEFISKGISEFVK